jgi:N-methylhydantoinase A/oxoprolinase/acetone carboxylase beta subunit
MTAPRRVGSDTGGTFTDVVGDDGHLAKVPSHPDDPSAAVGEGLAALGLAGVGGDDDQRAAAIVLAHGTTVATNALLERRGARVALVTNEGFADLIEIARQDRPSLYDQTIDRPTPLVPREWRYEVRGRLDATGAEIEPLDVSTIPDLDPAIEAVAVCLLHSDLNPAHEIAVKAALVARGLDVTASHELSPEFREYERTVTTVVNAYVRPVCSAYLRRLEGLAEDVKVMTSSGGLTTSADAAQRPAALLLSGPAGGVLAGAAIAAANGYADAVTFDMGGTSTDVCLVLGGQPEPASERDVAGFPVRLPSLDVHTIGAGGGSIARIDDGGALVVVPESAGAVPGPACYARGGQGATVTDANLVAGHIRHGAELPGLGRLDLDAARRALEAAKTPADGVIAVVNASMEQALRKVSIERGVDARRLALVAFGGAGPLHACALADALDMPIVIVPPRAGVFSAVGILGAPVRVDDVESCNDPLDHAGLAERVDRLVRGCVDRLGVPGGDWLAPEHAVLVGAALDCRYQGQSHELRVGSVDEFHDEHERRNGYARRDTPVEVVAIRAWAWREAPLSIVDLPAYERETGDGPTVIAEPDCTIWVPVGWRAEKGEAGALVLRRAETRPS